VKGQSTADAGATVVKEFDDMWPTENCFFPFLAVNENAITWYGVTNDAYSETYVMSRVYTCLLLLQSLTFAAKLLHDVKCCFGLFIL